MRYHLNIYIHRKDMEVRTTSRERYDRRASKAAVREELADVALEALRSSHDVRLTRLRPSNFGKRPLQEESAELYWIHKDMKGTLLESDGATICTLVELLHAAAIPSTIEDARRQVIASLLGDFSDDKMVQKALRNAHIKRNFQFTFTLSIGDGELHVIKLPESLCNSLRITDALSSHAYKTLDEFLAQLSTEERKKIEIGTAQYLDHGGKRYAYRIRFGGMNAVLIIAMDNHSEIAFRRLVEKEAELYGIAAGLALETVTVPEVFAILGSKNSAGIVMTDCTKGGNASLVCVQGKRQLVPEETEEAYFRDMRVIERAIPEFRLYGNGSVYVQKSNKTGETRIVLLDMENCVAEI